MASWSKRRTQTFKSSKNRLTRTNNSKGTSTNSSSYKVGNTRVTHSTNSATGKSRTYTTQTHPTLGTKREVRTNNPTVRYKKPKAPRKSRAKNYKSTNNSAVTYRHDLGYRWTMADQAERDKSWNLVWNVFGVIAFVFVLLLIGLFQ